MVLWSTGAQDGRLDHEASCLAATLKADLSPRHDPMIGHPDN